MFSKPACFHDRCLIRPGNHFFLVRVLGYYVTLARKVERRLFQHKHLIFDIFRGSIKVIRKTLVYLKYEKVVFENTRELYSIYVFISLG